MIFKKKDSKGRYFRLVDMCYAGSLPGVTTGGKTHVINLLYSVDLSRSPANGISKIILTISDKNQGINVPKINVAPTKRFAKSLQTINSDLKTLNTDNASNAHEYGVANISSPDKKNLNTSFLLLDPFSSDSKKKNNLGEFINRKVDESANRDSSVFKGMTSPFVKYGQRVSTKLVSVSDPNSKIPSPIVLSPEGVVATVQISPETLSDIADLDAEALSSNGGYPYSPDGSFNRSAVGPSSQVSTISLSNQSKIPGVSSPIQYALSEARNKTLSDRFNESASKNIFSNKGYTEACFLSAAEDKIDPAKSAIIPPIISPGMATITGEKLSDSIHASNIYESNKQIKTSDNQIAIKEKTNIIKKVILDKVSDIPENATFPQMVIIPDKTAEVSQMIPINSAYASSYNRLYATVKVYSGDGIVFQEKNFEIPLRQIVEQGSIPSLPPEIDVVAIKPGVMGITVSQADNNADSIEIYYREINKISGQNKKFIKLADISLTSEEGLQYIEHTPKTSCSLMYRAIAKTKNNKSCNFNSVICQPQDDFKKVVNQITSDAAICSYVNTQGNVEISLSNIRGGSQYIELRRRNISNFEKFFTRINTSDYQGQFVNSEDSVTFIDSSVQDGELYEYKIFSTSFDGITTECFRTTIIEYMKPLEDVVLVAKNPTALGGSSSMISNVAIPISMKVDSNEKNFISQIFENSGINQDDLDLVPDIATKVDQSLGVIINRIDETTGETAYIGFFPVTGEESSVFIDKGDASLNIPTPILGRVYKYVMEAVVLDLKSIISDSKLRKTGQNQSLDSAKSEIRAQIQRNKNDLTFTNDATSGVTPDPQNPNRPEKFFNKRTLGRGFDAGVLLEPASSTAQEIDLARTGVYAVATADLTIKAKPFISKGSCRVRSDGKVHIEWSAQNVDYIDHFLIKENRYGSSRVCLSAHNISNKGKYSIIDFNARHTPGTITYSVTPVSLEYQMGEEYIVGNVDILPENIESIPVTKDLPVDLLTSNRGSFEYPEI